MTDRPQTLRELKESGYHSVSVKQEMRCNLLHRLRSGAEVFPGIVGFDDTVIPQIEHAVLSRHDRLFLGLRGQGKTRMLRLLSGLLDDAIPIVAGSAMHQPTTAALLEPKELAGVCAESGSSPVSGGSPAMKSFLAAYKKMFGSAPDAFSLGAYDGVNMALKAVKGGARTAEAVRAALSKMTYKGLAMTYKSDGKGNMAHSAVIMCYDGKTRVPTIVKTYVNVSGVL